MKVYNRSELETKSRNELWQILDSLQLSRRRSIQDCVEVILNAMSQIEAQAEFDVYVQTQACDWQAEDDFRAEMNRRGYADSMAGLPEQIDDISYRSGYARAWRDMRVLPEEKATIEKASEPDTDMLTPYTLAEWEAIPKFPGMRYQGNGTWRDSKNNYTNSPIKLLTPRQLAILDGKIPKFASKARQFIRF